MPLGVGVYVRILVTFVYVGPVSRPAIIAETGLRRNVLSPVVTISVVSCVRERVVIGAVEVDPHSTALTPGHQISRAFSDLGR